MGGGWGGGEVGGGEAIAIARPLRKQAICLHNVPPPCIISLFYTLFMYRGRGVQIGLACKYSFLLLYFREKKDFLIREKVTKLR